MFMEKSEWDDVVMLCPGSIKEKDYIKYLIKKYGKQKKELWKFLVDFLTWYVCQHYIFDRCF